MFLKSGYCWRWLSLYPRFLYYHSIETFDHIRIWTARNDKKYMALYGARLKSCLPTGTCTKSSTSSLNTIDIGTTFYLTIFKIVKCSCKDSQVFLQKLSDFPVNTIKFSLKIGRFSLKNCKIYLKKLSTFPEKLQEKLTTFSRKFYEFFMENLLIFTQKFNRFYRNILRFL